MRDVLVLEHRLLAKTMFKIGGREWSVRAVPSPDPLLARVHDDEDMATFPYGLLLWPSAVALACHLADHAPLVCGRRVLELGCGPGLPGIVARWRKGLVSQTDYQAAPLQLARQNARQNGITGIAYQIGDWRDFPLVPPFDLVIGSDILYERALHPALRSLLPRLLMPGGKFLCADPLRPQAATFMDALAQDGWDVGINTEKVAWQSGTTEIAVFTARQNPSEPA